MGGAPSAAAGLPVRQSRRMNPLSAQSQRTTSIASTRCQ